MEPLWGSFTEEIALAVINDFHQGLALGVTEKQFLERVRGLAFNQKAEPKEALVKTPQAGGGANNQTETSEALVETLQSGGKLSIPRKPPSTWAPTQAPSTPPRSSWRLIPASFWASCWSSPRPEVTIPRPGVTPPASQSRPG